MGPLRGFDGPLGQGQDDGSDVMMPKLKKPLSGMMVRIMYMQAFVSMDIATLRSPNLFLYFVLYCVFFWMSVSM